MIYTDFEEREFNCRVGEESSPLLLKLLFRHIAPCHERRAKESGILDGIDRCDPDSLAQFLVGQLTTKSKSDLEKLHNQHGELDSKLHETLSILFGIPVPWNMLEFFFILRGEKKEQAKEIVEDIKNRVDDLISEKKKSTQTNI